MIGEFQRALLKDLQTVLRDNAELRFKIDKLEKEVGHAAVMRAATATCRAPEARSPPAANTAGGRGMVAEFQHEQEQELVELMEEQARLWAYRCALHAEMRSRHPASTAKDATSYSGTTGISVVTAAALARAPMACPHAKCSSSDMDGAAAFSVACKEGSSGGRAWTDGVNAFAAKAASPATRSAPSGMQVKAASDAGAASSVSSPAGAERGTDARQGLGTVRGSGTAAKLTTQKAATDGGVVSVSTLATYDLLSAMDRRWAMTDGGAIVQTIVPSHTTRCRPSEAPVDCAAAAADGSVSTTARVPLEAPSPPATYPSFGGGAWFNSATQTLHARPPAVAASAVPVLEQPPMLTALKAGCRQPDADVFGRGRAWWSMLHRAVAGVVCGDAA
eukprot:362203-Chlamydomonas_euryale.AAC.5